MRLHWFFPYWRFWEPAFGLKLKKILIVASCLLYVRIVLLDLYCYIIIFYPTLTCLLKKQIGATCNDWNVTVSHKIEMSLTLTVNQKQIWLRLNSVPVLKINTSRDKYRQLTRNVQSCTLEYKFWKFINCSLPLNTGNHDSVWKSDLH